MLVRAGMPANGDVANVLPYFLGKTAQSQPLVVVPTEVPNRH